MRRSNARSLFIVHADFGFLLMLRLCPLCANCLCISRRLLLIDVTSPLSCSSPFLARLSSLASRISWRFLFFARTSKLGFTLTMLSRVASHYSTCALPRVHEKRQLSAVAYLRRARSTMPSLKIDRSTARSARDVTPRVNLFSRRTSR